MTYQKDYILRMIEMIGDLIAGILGLIKKGHFAEAENKINSAYSELLKEEAALFHQIPKENLTTVLLENHDYSDGHLEILAELFYAEAELNFAKGKFQASQLYYEKSLILLDFVLKESKTFSVEKLSRKRKPEDSIAGLKN